MGRDTVGPGRYGVAVTEVLAGAVGGALALLGGFLVQWQSGRRADRIRLRQLVAEIKGARDALMVGLFENRNGDQRSAYRELSQATAEVMLLGSGAVFDAADDLRGAVNAYLAGTKPGHMDQAQINPVNDAIVALMAAVRRETLPWWKRR